MPRITCAGSGRDDATEESSHHRDLHALLRFNATGEVTLRQVSQLVRQHRGAYSAFGLGVRGNRPPVHADDTAWRGKRVESRAVDQDELQTSVVHLAGLSPAIHAGFDVVFELRVVQLGNLPTQVGQPGTAQLVFLSLARQWQNWVSPSDGRSSAKAWGGQQVSQRQQGGRKKLMHIAFRQSS